MIPWGILCALSTIALVAVGVPHGISSHADLMELWAHLRKHHAATWRRLGGPDAATEFFTERNVGSLRKVYPILDAIDDPELKVLVETMKRHDRFAERVVMPVFLVAIATVIGYWHA